MKDVGRIVTSEHQSRLRKFAILGMKTVERYEDNNHKVWCCHNNTKHRIIHEGLD